MLLSLYGRVLYKPIDKPPKIPTYKPWRIPNPTSGDEKLRLPEKKIKFFVVVYDY